MATSRTWIRVPHTKPATEWLLGGPVRKVSPKTRHSRAQFLLALALEQWGGTRGIVGPELHVYPALPGEPHRPLVPDVAYISNERIAQLTGEEREDPPFSPDIAIEVRSPDDKQRFIDHKIEVYLATGARVVLIVDPLTRMVVAHTREGIRRYAEADTFEHEAMPGFRLVLADFFARVNAHHR